MVDPNLAGAGTASSASKFMQGWSTCSNGRSIRSIEGHGGTHRISQRLGGFANVAPACAETSKFDGSAENLLPKPRQDVFRVWEREIPKADFAIQHAAKAREEGKPQENATADMFLICCSCGCQAPHSVSLRGPPNHCLARVQTSEDRVGLIVGPFSESLSLKRL